MKKWEAGAFRRVKTQEGASRVEIDAGELAMLLEGSLSVRLFDRSVRVRQAVQPARAGETTIA